MLFENTERQIILTGTPISTQTAYRSSCRGKFPTVYMKPEAKNLKEAYMWEAKTQWKDKPLDGPLGVSLKFYHKTHGKHDIDNFNKLVLDAMTGVLWKDDSQIETMHLKKYVDKEFPRVELTVWIVE